VETNTDKKLAKVAKENRRVWESQTTNKNKVNACEINREALHEQEGEREREDEATSPTPHADGWRMVVWGG